ncbi:osmC-like protein [Seminavis robusta]|uniref:OsmC-like protein n=1 Tax=Seminavis robusta TaxID=568900 RepID=A0A9N8H7K6_9STRA|nr:osmC-like protein [Seminavis robusta]|eukprot:Sro207_g086770.1 osmC-like protein (741) ;mRNA; f:19642-22169
MVLRRLLLCFWMLLIQWCLQCHCVGLGTGIPGDETAQSGLRRKKNGLFAKNDSQRVSTTSRQPPTATVSIASDNHRNLMQIVASGHGEYTFEYDGGASSSSTGSGQTAHSAGGDLPPIENAQGDIVMPGPGCSFPNFDGTTTTFLEGQSMGTYRMIHSCANNVPEAFPCYCISGAPGQMVCPYCFYRDTFNNNVCGRSGEIIGVLHPNRTLLNCQCTVAVEPFGSSYDVKITSNCDMVDLTTAAPSSGGGGSFGIDTSTTPPVTVTPVATPPPTSTFVFPTTPAPSSTFVFPTTPAPVTALPVPPPTLGPTTGGGESLGDGGLGDNNNNNIANPVVTYQPGNLTIYQDGLWLSQGLTARVLAIAGEKVPYEAPGSEFLAGSTNALVARQTLMESQVEFHYDPDGAATFLDNRPSNTGGWIYVSNSEKTDGGVGAVTFNAQGQVIDYRRLLQGTLWNCNGGKTPWGTWVTAEEDTDKFEGRLWQVDPYGVRDPMPLTLGSGGGAWEAFAYDIRDLNKPYYFVTEDDEEGAMHRWTPDSVVWGMDPWMMLHGSGQTDYLILQPDFDNGNGNNGTFYWTADLDEARDNAKDFYQYSEGIDVHGNILTFVCKGDYILFRLNLDTMKYERKNTRAGLFDGEPDQVRTILQDDGSTLLYFSEDYGNVAGIHARDEDGNFFTILEGPDFAPETTGISFSPDGKRMYFQFQEDGYLFEATRDDGLSFHAATVNLKPRLTEDPRKYRRQ